MIKKILSTGFLVLILATSIAPVFAQTVDVPAYCDKFKDDKDVRKLKVAVGELDSLCKNKGNTCKNVSAAFAAIKELDSANNAIEKVKENGLNDYKGFCDNQTKLVEDTKAKSLQDVRKELTKLGNCASLDPSDAVGCLEDVAENDRTEIDKLQDAIIRGDLVSILEEPIGDKGVFNRARICETRFVRDIRGNLQLIDSNVTLNPTENVARQYRTETANCRSYIVEECRPTGAIESTANATVGSEANVAGTLPVTIYCDEVQIIYASSGVDLLKTYVGLIYRWAAGIIGVIAVLVVMISGIQMSASGGDSAKIDEAKERIIQSLVAIAVLFLSGIILYAINPTFFLSKDIQAQQEQRAVEAQERADEERTNSVQDSVKDDVKFDEDGLVDFDNIDV